MSRINRMSVIEFLKANELEILVVEVENLPGTFGIKSNTELIEVYDYNYVSESDVEDLFLRFTTNSSELFDRCISDICNEIY